MFFFVTLAAMNNQLILSVFPGIDLFGRAFEDEGFCVVRGPDLIWGGDIRKFHPPSGCWAGIIGGPPCQDFSKLRRTKPTGNGLKMLQEFTRTVTEAQPEWALIENVPTVPTVKIPGYEAQRFALSGEDCGLTQKRTRHFQFFSHTGRPLILQLELFAKPTEAAAVAREGTQTQRRGFPEFCRLQGLDSPIELPGMSIAARYQAVGNGVPLPMGRVVAQAIKTWTYTTRHPRLCECGCGRILTGKERTASIACRKRKERRTKFAGQNT